MSTTYIAIGQGAWGKGSSKAAAVAEARRQRGIRIPVRQLLVFEIPADVDTDSVHVDQLGYLRFRAPDVTEERFAELMNEEWKQV